MKRLITILTILVLITGCNEPKATESLTADTPGFVLSDGNVEVKIGEDGALLSLVNKETGHNYASGEGLWRMFYNTHQEKEMQIDGTENTPAVSQEGDVITIAYKDLMHRGKALRYGVGHRGPWLCQDISNGHGPRHVPRQQSVHRWYIPA